MVDNTGNFCVPYLKLRYSEGFYAARQYYPRLVCCRHTHAHEPLPGPGRGMAYSSPPTSPTHGAATLNNTLLSTRVEGSTVVSKIARPPPHPESCCPTPGGGGGGGGGEGGGGGSVGGPPGGRGGVQVVVHQPTRTAPNGPWMFMPGGCVCRHATPTSVSCTSNSTSNNNITTSNSKIATTTSNSPTPNDTLISEPLNSPCATTSSNVSSSPVARAERPLVVEHSLTPGSGELDKYLQALSNGEVDTSVPAMKDGSRDTEGESEMNCYTGPLSSPGSANTPPATPPPPDGHLPASKVSDASDFSDDYTQMTDVTGMSDVTSNSIDVLEDAGVSVYSDVFSDDGMTLETDCADLAAVGSVGVSKDVISGMDDENVMSYDNDQLNDLENDMLDMFANVRIDSPTEKTLLHPFKDKWPAVYDDLDSPKEPICVLPPGISALQGQHHLSYTGESIEDNISDPELCDYDHATGLEVDMSELRNDDLETGELPTVDLREDAPVSRFYEDREFDFLNAPRVKRSTSLKTYKTPPGTPKRKMVRFADALGLDLESVRHILNQEGPPRIPRSATRDLDLPWRHPRGVGEVKLPTSQGARYLTACFLQPGINPTFPLMVRERRVLLESCVIHDHDLSVSGTVRVANLHFHKEVIVRYTTNNWLTHSDISAGYVHNSNDGPTDRFAFSISLPTYFSTGNRLQFCIRYVTGGEEFWDSNHGGNYMIECYARALPESDTGWTSFL